MTERTLGDLNPVLFLTMVVFISAAALTITNLLTEDKIAEQKDKKVQESLTELFPNMDRFEYDDNTEIYSIYADTDLIGYAFIAEGTGYGGTIEILVGLQDLETIQGIVVVSHTETPGLGNKITESSFTDQFVGLSITDVRLTKDGGQVDAITGATISSNAVVDAVRSAAQEKVELIQE